MFIEFTRRSGSKVAVNTERVQYISDAGNEGTYIYFTDSESLSVREDYATVLANMRGSSTAPAQYLSAVANA